MPIIGKSGPDKHCPRIILNYLQPRQVSSCSFSDFQKLFIIWISQQHSNIVVIKGVTEPVCGGNIVSVVRTRAVVVLKRIPSTASEPPPCLCRFHERQPSDLRLGKVRIRATVVNN